MFELRFGNFRNTHGIAPDTCQLLLIPEDQTLETVTGGGHHQRVAPGRHIHARLPVFTMIGGTGRKRQQVRNRNFQRQRRCREARHHQPPTPGPCAVRA